MQPGFFDLNSRYEQLDKLGDPLPTLSALVDWEGFRSLLSRIRQKERKSGSGRKPLLASVPYTFIISYKDTSTAPSAIAGTFGISLVTPIFCARFRTESIPVCIIKSTATELTDLVKPPRREYAPPYFPSEFSGFQSS